MDLEFVGCDANQSGQRLLGNSDPRLIRHVVSCETAGGGITPLPAGKDEKLPREFEGGALIGREAPVPFPLCLGCVCYGSPSGCSSSPARAISVRYNANLAQEQV